MYIRKSKTSPQLVVNITLKILQFINIIHFKIQIFIFHNVEPHSNETQYHSKVPYCGMLHLIRLNLANHWTFSRGNLNCFCYQSCCSVFGLNFMLLLASQSDAIFWNRWLMFKIAIFFFKFYFRKNLCALHVLFFWFNFLFVSGKISILFCKQWGQGSKSFASSDSIVQP